MFYLKNDSNLSWCWVLLQSFNQVSYLNYNSTSLFSINNQWCTSPLGLQLLSQLVTPLKLWLLSHGLSPLIVKAVVTCLVMSLHARMHRLLTELVKSSCIVKANVQKVHVREIFRKDNKPYTMRKPHFKTPIHYCILEKYEISLNSIHHKGLIPRFVTPHRISSALPLTGFMYLKMYTGYISFT